jgi:hypothetical protein
MIGVLRGAVIVAAILAGLGVMLVTGANLLLTYGEVPYRILARVPAPGGRFEAVLTMRQISATVPTPTAIYVVRSGMSNAFAPVLLADHVERLRLEWKDGAHLIIRAKAARIFRKVETEKVDLSEGTVPVTVTYEIGSGSAADDEKPWDAVLQQSHDEATSSINYGAAGIAAGYPEWLLLRLAGWNRKRAGTSRPEWGSPWGDAPYGDDPNDQLLIRAGFAFARAEKQ